MTGLDSKIFLDLIGLYYCVDVCGHRGVTWAIITNVVRKLNQRRGRVSVVLVWDKLKNIDNNEISEFINKIRLNIGRGFRYAPRLETCREPTTPGCEFVTCKNHRAYCCMCTASKGDVLISMKAGSSADCQIGDRDRLTFDDGVREESEELNCDQVPGTVCPVVICNKV